MQFAAIELPVNTTGQYLATGARVSFEGRCVKTSVTVVDSSGVVKLTKINAIHADIVDTRNASGSE